MNDEFEGQPQVNPPTVTPDPAFANYMGMLGMPSTTAPTTPAVAQGGLANQQPGAGASVANQNQNYMSPYWLGGQQKNPLSIGTGAGSLIGAASGGGGGGCD